MLNAQAKKILAIVLSISLLIVIGFYSYKLSRPMSSEYKGTSNESLQVQSENVTTETIVDQNGVSRNIVVANDPSFEPRIMTGGGETPSGWLISVTETQPRVFTGKLLYKNGVETYDLFLQEIDGFFTGDAKFTKDKTVKQLSMQKQNNLCKDTEGNTYEYTLIASFDGSNLSGCGGSVVEIKK